MSEHQARPPQRVRDRDFHGRRETLLELPLDALVGAAEALELCRWECMLIDRAAVEIAERLAVERVDVDPAVRRLRP
jgi:hypothetical protein